VRVAAARDSYYYCCSSSLPLKTLVVTAAEVERTAT